MDINWKPGKTELVVAWRRNAANKQKEKLRREKGRTMFDVGGKKHRYCGKSARCKTDNAVGVNVAPIYKHLGDIIEQNSNMVPEARNRERSALASFSALASKIIGNRSVAISRRLALAKSVVISKLLYNIQTWTRFESKPRSIINAMYMRIWRRVIGDPRFQCTVYTDIRVRSILGARCVRRD